MSNPVLEMPETDEVAHSTESRDYFCSSALTCCLDTPVNQVILEEAFVKLVQDVWRNAREYVQMR
jgi:hypothetical protein